MRPLRPGLVLVLLTLVLGGPRTAHAEFVLFKKIWGNVMVATDTTAAGRELTPPTREQPVYYRGKSLGRHLGSIPGDEEPTEKELNRVVADVLAKQGYIGARPGVNEPALFIVVQWGYMTPSSGQLVWFLGYDASHDIANWGSPILADFRSSETEAIIDAVQNPVYGIIVTAFDFKTANTSHPVACWQTRIGLPARGKSMAAALPVMLLAAGPAIGRPAEQMAMFDADTAREVSIKFGELKFLDDVHEPDPHKTDSSRK